MSENLGRCPLCGDEKHPGAKTFAVDLKFGVVVVRGVPAFVCTKCGDAWIDGPVVAKLEKHRCGRAPQTYAGEGYPMATGGGLIPVWTAR